MVCCCVEVSGGVDIEVSGGLTRILPLVALATTLWWKLKEGIRFLVGTHLYIVKVITSATTLVSEGIRFLVETHLSDIR